MKQINYMTMMPEHYGACAYILLCGHSTNNSTLKSSSPTNAHLPSMRPVTTKQVYACNTVETLYLQLSHLKHNPECLLSKLMPKLQLSRG